MHIYMYIYIYIYMYIKIANVSTAVHSPNPCHRPDRVGQVFCADSANKLLIIRVREMLKQ